MSVKQVLCMTVRTLKRETLPKAINREGNMDTSRDDSILVRLPRRDRPHHPRFDAILIFCLC